jgi:hypothetical protein
MAHDALYAAGRNRGNSTPAGSVAPVTTNFDPAYGGKPAIPDPESILRDTIGANLGMMPDIKGLGKKVSNYFWNQTTGRVPGYEDMAGQSAQNIGAQLRGEVPEDVLYQIGQGAAERGISRGGGFSNADYLRSLGLTSLGLMGEGEKGLTGALQRAESIPMFDISKYMLSPQEAYNAQFQSNVIGAAPDPAAAARALRDELAKSSKTTPGRITTPTALGGATTPTTPGFDWNAWGLGRRTPSTTKPDTYNPWGPGGWTGGAGVPGGGDWFTGKGGDIGIGLPGGTVEGYDMGTGEGAYSEGGGWPDWAYEYEDPGDYYGYGDWGGEGY